MKRLLSLIAAGVLVMSTLTGCAQKTPEPTATEVQEEVSQETEAPAAEEASNTLDTEALKGILIEDNAVVVDTRNSAAFNGWALADESRGGHIPGATLFDAAWLEMIEGDDAVAAELERMGIVKDKAVVLYGYGTDSASVLAQKLSELGYENVKIYADGFEAWSADDSNEVASLAKYELLVYPEWVNEKMNAGEVKVYEVSWGPGDNYVKGHIPAAAHINTDDFEVGPLWNRKSDSEIEAAMLKNGISSDTAVVLYGDDSTASARIASILMYAGVEDVRLLDGGFSAWKAAGLEVAEGGVEAEPVADFGVVVPQHPEYIIDMEEAQALIDSENGRLVSIRSWAEYIGETSGYDYIEKAGRIEGDVYGYAGSDPWHMEDYRTPANTMLNYEMIKDRWESQDITADTDNAFYCGTGWRASETWFYAYLLGFENVSVYDGGWKEWSETEGAPIATGEPVTE